MGLPEGDRGQPPSQRLCPRAPTAQAPCPTGQSSALIQFPAQAISLAHTSSHLVYCRIGHPTGPRPEEPIGRLPVPPLQSRHNDGVTVGFADGHAKCMRGEELLNPPAEGTQDRIEFNRLWGHRLNQRRPPRRRARHAVDQSHLKGRQATPGDVPAVLAIAPGSAELRAGGDRHGLKAVPAGRHDTAPPCGGT